MKPSEAYRDNPLRRRRKTLNKPRCVVGSVHSTIEITVTDEWQSESLKTLDAVVAWCWRPSEAINGRSTIHTVATVRDLSGAWQVVNPPLDASRRTEIHVALEPLWQRAIDAALNSKQRRVDRALRTIAIDSHEGRELATDGRIDG